MRCPRCGELIPLDSMTCQVCRHDLLPADISHQPLTGLSRNAAEYAHMLFQDRLRDKGVIPRDPEADAALAEATRRLEASRWRIWPIVAGLVALEVSFLLLRR